MELVDENRLARGSTFASTCRYHARAMNPRGNPETLVQAHPGNTNAVRHGAYSPRLIESRAAELEVELLSAELSATERVAVREVARCIAVLEAIDRDLDERGIVTRTGDARSLLEHRARISRRLESWLAMVSTAMKLHSSNGAWESYRKRRDRPAAAAERPAENR